MAGKGSLLWVALALVVAVLALGWPQIEQQLIASGVGCPWPFTMLGDHGHGAENAQAAEAEGLTVYTVEELKKYDGSDESLPILLAIGGKVVDVLEGAKFYAPGKMYHQFAGTACSRALTLSSLKLEDVSDDISDFTDKQKKSLQDTMEFYYDKYPIVGELDHYPQ